MRMVDVKCEGDIDEDGNVTLIISASNLTIAEAQAIGDKAKEPFRAIVHEVLGKGDQHLESRDMMVKPQ
jgi:hypothetical protein